MQTEKVFSLKEVIQKHDLVTKKSLGQHFLLDGNITDKIVRFVPEITSSVIFEIGPGPGGLTYSLLKAGAKKVIAVETDKRCVQALEELKKLFPNQLDIVCADALKTNLLELLDEEDHIQIVSNLPYNISTLLLAKWLEEISCYTALTLMFQREVAQRLLAKPRTKEYGRLSVLTQWLCEGKKLFDLPASAFVPPPKVMSTVVQFIPRQQPLYPASFKKLEHVLKKAFGQRRKMLRSIFKDQKDIFEKEKIDLEKRAEELSIKEFCALSELI